MRSVAPVLPSLLALGIAVCLTAAPGCGEGEVFGHGDDDDDGDDDVTPGDDDTTTEEPPPRVGGPGLYSAIAADDQGAAHIIHYALDWPLGDPDEATGELRYVTNGGGAWTRARVADGALRGGRSALLIDGDDDAHASFARGGLPTYGYRDNVSWDLVAVDASAAVASAPLTTDLALDADGLPHVTFVDAGALRHASGERDDWTVETLASGDIGEDHALAITPDGTIHVIYRDAADGVLVHVYGGAGGWSETAVDADGDPGHAPSLVVDSSGTLHACHRDAAAGTLRYATTASGAWTTETIDDGGQLGAGGSAIGVGGDGVVHVVYYDEATGNLCYASDAGGSWVRSDLDSAGDVGRHPAITVDDDDRVHISYMAWREDLGISALKYATDRTGFWEIWLAEDPDDLD